MKENFFIGNACFLLVSLFSLNLDAGDVRLKKKLEDQYEFHSQQSSDIYEHIPVLRALASECASVTEIGLRSMNSTWGVLLGLSEHSSEFRKYVGIDLDYPPESEFHLARYLAEANGVTFCFVHANDMDIDIEPTEMLFIDSLHTYCHLTYELEKFSPNVTKYIAMHDTDEPWGFIDDFQQYHGDRSEYPDHIDRNKRGLWQAVLDFLDSHPDWVLHERRLNNHGFTVLKRVGA